MPDTPTAPPVPAAGCSFGEYNGNPLIVLAPAGSTGRPPQFGFGKANTIVELADAGVSPDHIQTALAGFSNNGYKFKPGDTGPTGELIIAGSRSLLLHVAHIKTAAAAAAAPAPAVPAEAS